MKSLQITVTDVPTLLVASDNQNRTVYLHNKTNDVVFIGNSTVTIGNGMDIAKHTAPITLFVPSNETIFGIAEAGKTIDMRILTPNLD